MRLSLNVSRDRAGDWKNILAQAKDSGVEQILLAGNDLFLRPDFCDIAELAVDKGFVVDVCTSGVGLTAEIFERLRKLKLNRVAFNLYGGDSELHDKITGVKGSFAETIDALERFKGSGVNTCIKSVVTRQNFHGLQKLCELGERLKVEIYISAKIDCADYRLLCNKDFVDTAFKKNSSRGFSEKFLETLATDSSTDIWSENLDV